MLSTSYVKKFKAKSWGTMQEQMKAASYSQDTYNLVGCDDGKIRGSSSITKDII